MIRDDTIHGATILQGSAALAAAPPLPRPARAQAPPPQAITPELIEAARKEGKVVLYSSMDLPVGEKLGKAFEENYPGIAVQIERSGSERLFQRIDQEFASNINAADVINTLGCLAFHPLEKERLARRRSCPEDIAEHFPPSIATPRGMFATTRDLAVVDRLQHQSRQAGGGAEKLCRPARSEMDGQDGEGASRPIAAPS